MKEYMEKLLLSSKGTQYDIAVMYSGGKDSSYLLYYFSEVLKLRTRAVMVDTGYESEYLLEHLSEFPEKLGIPLEIIRPGKEIFSPFFHMLVAETDLFRRDGVNHVCFICNNILWATVCSFAAQNDIPFVASGLSSAQLNSGRNYDLKIDNKANQITEYSTKYIFKDAYSKMKQSVTYNENAVLQEYIDTISNGFKKVTTVYPYLYLNMSVSQLKDTLLQLGWKPPKDISAEKYISSGCSILSQVVSEMEKLGLLCLNEREQAKKMVDHNLIGAEQLAFANYDASKDVVNLCSPLMDELKIKDYLVECCKMKKREHLI